MDMQRIIRTLEELPAEQMHEVEEFIASLRVRGCASPVGDLEGDAPSSSGGAPSFTDETFFGAWRDRPEMAESVQWVRDLRAAQWDRLNRPLEE